MIKKSAAKMPNKHTRKAMLEVRERCNLVRAKDADEMMMQLDIQLNHLSNLSPRRRTGSSQPKNKL